MLLFLVSNKCERVLIVKTIMKTYFIRGYKIVRIMKKKIICKKNGRVNVQIKVAKTEGLKKNLKIKH